MEFRISICLTRYFEDERSYCYMMVEERGERVAALERRLRALFQLRGSFCLMSRDHYLPREEKLSILRPDDTITIIPLENDWREEEVGSLTEVKCKSESEQEAEVAPRGDALPDKIGKKKKKKKIKSESTNDASEVAPGSSPARPASTEPMDATNQQDVPHDDALRQLKLKALTLLHEVTAGVSSVGSAGGVSSGRVTKRRRVRRRNRRSSLALPSSPPSSRSPSSAPPSPAPTPILVPPPIPLPSPPPPLLTSNTVPERPTHTRFPSESGVPPVLQNASLVGTMSGRVVRASGAGDGESGEIAPSVTLLLRRLHEFPVMDAVTYPMPRDLVLFKTLRLESGAPRTSGAVLGRVLRVDKPAAAVVFRVLDGAEELRGAGFGGGDEVEVPWTSVLDPRLIFP